jgi:hypothetical protein
VFHLISFDVKITEIHGIIKKLTKIGRFHLYVLIREKVEISEQNCLFCVVVEGDDCRIGSKSALVSYLI